MKIRPQYSGMYRPLFRYNNSAGTSTSIDIYKDILLLDIPVREAGRVCASLNEMIIYTQLMSLDVKDGPS